MTNLMIDDQVSMNMIGGLTSNGALVTNATHATVTETTEKAVKLTGETHNGKAIHAWFPRKALRITGTREEGNMRHVMVETARWFHLDDWTARFMNLAV